MEARGIVDSKNHLQEIMRLITTANRLYFRKSESNYINAYENYQNALDELNKVSSEDTDFRFQKSHCELRSLLCLSALHVIPFDNELKEKLETIRGNLLKQFEMTDHPDMELLAADFEAVDSEINKFEMTIEVALLQYRYAQLVSKYAFDSFNGSAMKQFFVKLCAEQKLNLSQVLNKAKISAENSVALYAMGGSDAVWDRDSAKALVETINKKMKSIKQEEKRRDRLSSDHEVKQLKTLSVISKNMHAAGLQQLQSDPVTATLKRKRIPMPEKKTLPVQPQSHNTNVKSSHDSPSETKKVKKVRTKTSGLSFFNRPSKPKPSVPVVKASPIMKQSHPIFSAPSPMPGSAERELLTPCTPEGDKFINAIKRMLECVNPDLIGLFYSRLLHTIAYCQDKQFGATFITDTDILVPIYDLYDKAAMLSKNQHQAVILRDQKFFLDSTISLCGYIIDDKVFDFSYLDTGGKPKRSADNFRHRQMQRHDETFFWGAIKDYVAQLEKIYPNDFRAHLIQILNSAKTSGTFKEMLARKDQILISHLFDETISELQQARNKLTA